MIDPCCKQMCSNDEYLLKINEISQFCYSDEILFTVFSSFLGGFVKSPMFFW